VGFAFDHDPLDAAPADEVTALSNESSVAESVWKNFSLDVTKYLGTSSPGIHYVRRCSVAPPSGADLKTYDCGNLHVYSLGVATATALGMLEVEYELDLFHPELSPPIGGGAASTTGITATNLVGSDFTPTARALLPFVASVVGANGRFSFPNGFQGLLTHAISGTVIGNGNIGNVSAGSAVEVDKTVVNSGQTAGQTDFHVKMIPNSWWEPALNSCTTCTQSEWNVAECVLEALT
jgi:hypothetical protein